MAAKLIRARYDARTWALLAGATVPSRGSCSLAEAVIG